MELILWRHADAEPGKPDSVCALTPKGKKQARKVAGWLDRHLPSNCRIIVSPTMRTVQTADAFNRKYKMSAAVGPDATVEDILAVANWPGSREPVVIVGHQPALGRVAALLLSGATQDWTMRKGSLLWIARQASNDASAAYLKAATSPDLIDR